MADERLNIVVALKGDANQALKRLSKQFSGLKGVAGVASRAIGGVTRSLFSLKGAVAAIGVGFLAKSFLNAASSAEQFGVRLKVLLGSAKEGNKLFKSMAKFASTVSFEYKDIMESATALAGVMKGGVKEIEQWMPMITDLAAASGLSIEETTGQIIRMYSAGAGAAELFRVRGIIAMLGFKAGVTYSADETKKKLIEAFEDPQSKFRGASRELAKTWSGAMSMLSDAWFQFRNDVMSEGVFDFLKGAVSALLDEIKRLRDSGELKEWAKSLGETAINAFESIIIGIGATVDAVRMAVGKILAIYANLIRTANRVTDTLSGNLEQTSLAQGFDATAEHVKTQTKILAELTDVLNRYKETGDLVTQGTRWQGKSLEELESNWSALVKQLGSATGAVEMLSTAEGKSVVERERWIRQSLELAHGYQTEKIGADFVGSALERLNTIRAKSAEIARKAAEEARKNVVGGPGGSGAGMVDDTSGIVGPSEATLDRANAELFGDYDAQKEEAERRKKLFNDLSSAASQSFGDMASAFGDMYQLMGNKSREFLIAWKAMQIAQTVINTIVAAQNAYARGTELAGSGAAGVALGIAMAAAATAAGMARVALISSQGFAEGGEVGGHSPNSKADNIPARLTAGEWVVQRAAAAKYGPHIMEAINQMRVPRSVLSDFAMPNYRRGSSHFAEGGSVTRGPMPTMSTGDDGKPINIINVSDPAEFERFASSKPGERAILNVLSRNPYVLRRIVGR